MKIIKHGVFKTPQKITAHRKCSTCCCEFEFELSEIKRCSLGFVVACPECKEYIYLGNSLNEIECEATL